MIQHDLFEYPMKSGWNAQNTSRAAAHAIERTKAPTLRERALDLFRRKFEMTADECAEILGESILAVRPRISELHARNLITDSGARRVSDGGKMAIVWKLA